MSILVALLQRQTDTVLFCGDFIDKAGLERLECLNRPPLRTSVQLPIAVNCWQSGS